MFASNQVSIFNPEYIMYVKLSKTPESIVRAADAQGSVSYIYHVETGLFTSVNVPL